MGENTLTMEIPAAPTGTAERAEWARRHTLATMELVRRESPETDAVPHTPDGITGLLDEQVQVAAAALDA